MSDLHLCNTHGQLMAALCDVTQTADPVVVVYLDDEVPLNAGIQDRLRKSFPHLTLHVCQDSAMATGFANLPAMLPALIRRNLRWQGGWFQTPQHWQPAMLAGQHFTHAYTHNTGFFMAKVIAGMADTVTLREGGLNNYTGRPVRGIKRILRLLTGNTPGWQIMGEEQWITRIAVARPDDLPAAVRGKGVGHDLQGALAKLSAAQKQTLLHCLAPNLPALPALGRTALLLTQPLDLVGMCDTATKTQIYAAMVARLQAAGFHVFLKNHPRDAPFALPGTTLLDPITPIELWPLTSTRRFDLGVALCSAALSHGTDALCARAIQLIAPADFHAVFFGVWQHDIPARLDAALNT